LSKKRPANVESSKMEETNKENKKTFGQNIKKKSQKSLGCPLMLITILRGAHCCLGYLGKRKR